MSDLRGNLVVLTLKTSIVLQCNFQSTLFGFLWWKEWKLPVIGIVKVVMCFKLSSAAFVEKLFKKPC